MPAPSRHLWACCILGVLLAAPAASGDPPARQTRGPLGVLPTLLLVYLVPQHRPVSSAEPPLIRWWHKATNDELRRRVGEGRLEEWHWRAALRRSGAIRARARWVAGSTYHVAIVHPGWVWPNQVRLAVAPPLPHEEEQVARNIFAQGSFAGFPVAPVVAGRQRLRFQIEVVGSGNTVLWRGPWSVRVEGIRSNDEIIPPSSVVPPPPLPPPEGIDPAEIVQILPGPPDARVQLLRSDPAPQLRISLATGAFGWQDHVAYAGEFELRCADQVIARGPFHILQLGDAMGRLLGSITVEHPRVSDLSDPAERAHWTLTLRGGGPAVAQHLGAAVYWDGQSTYRLNDIWPQDLPAPAPAPVPMPPGPRS